MHAKIVVRTVRDTHQFIPLLVLVFTFWEEAVHDVHGSFRVVSELFFGLLIERHIFGADPQSLKPLLETVDPFLMQFWCVLGTAKILHLHLLEFTRAEDEVARSYFIAK